MNYRMTAPSASQRYYELFKNALVYTVAIRILNGTVQASRTEALLVVVLAIFGIVVVTMSAQAELSAYTKTVTSEAGANTLSIVIFLLAILTDVLVQYASTAIAQVLIFSFETSVSYATTAAGVTTGLMLLYAVRAAGKRLVD